MNHQNSVFFQGIITSPIEEIIIDGRVAGVKYRLQCINDRKKKDGTPWQEKCSIAVKAWGRVAQEIGAYKEGDEIKIQGKLKLESYTNKQGVKVFNHAIQMENLDTEIAQTPKVVVPQQTSFAPRKPFNNPKQVPSLPLEQQTDFDELPF